MVHSHACHGKTKRPRGFAISSLLTRRTSVCHCGDVNCSPLLLVRQHGPCTHDRDFLHLLSRLSSFTSAPRATVALCNSDDISALFSCPNHDSSSAAHRSILMEIFSQLLHAVTGYGGEQAHEVRSPFSNITRGAVDHPKTICPRTLRNTRADAMPHQTNDESPHPPTAFPPNPYSRASPTTSRPSTTASIDLTSPTRHPRSSDQRDIRTSVGRSRPSPKYKRSDDEKRLVGDYEYGHLWIGSEAGASS